MTGVSIIILMETMLWPVSVAGRTGRCVWAVVELAKVEREIVFGLGIGWDNFMLV